MRTLKVVLLGFGVIGQGFAETLLNKESFLAKRGMDLKVVAIGERDGCMVNEDGVDLKEALKLRKEGKPLNSSKDWKKVSSSEVLGLVEADVAVEVVPSNIKTGQPGVSLIKEALKNGMHAVSSDKCAMAADFVELKKLAESKNKMLLYEGSAGGAMPLMCLVRECMQINEIVSVKGILNGTTNYILTKMHYGNMDLETALREAQELGYAEADPTYDVEGIDAAAKIVILANDIMGMKKTFKDVKVTGITGITKQAVQLAKKNGYVIKLIAEINGEGLSVGPKLVPANSTLNVSGSLNALMFETDVAKDLTVVGRGAGRIETQSAIFSDLINIAKCQQQ